MAPERPGHSAPPAAHTVSPSDSDSGCALEEYLDVKAHPNTVKYSLSRTDTQELNLIRTLLQLLPPQDCDEKFCTTLGELERRELRNFNTYRRRHCMRHGVIGPVTSSSPHSCCMGCGGQILVGDMAVHTDHFEAEDFRWHLSCFVCETCHVPLSQFIYFLQDGRIYCGRHHAELTRSRCAACDQLILSDRCTVAEGHCWHVEHFCCWECEEVLGGGRYVMKGGRPFCNGCFQRLHAETCEACAEPIDPAEDLVTLKGQYWHSSPSCFCCSGCRAPLRTSEFIAHDDHLYCSQYCLSYGPQTYHPFKSQSNAARSPSPQCCSQRSRSRLGYTSWNDCLTDNTRKGLNSNFPESLSITRCQARLSRRFSDKTSKASDLWHPGYMANQVLDGEEESSCSSSDSEPEGYFLGRPIPNYSLSRGTDSPVHIKSKSIKRQQRSKSCKVS
ncbi:prickle-like protein 1 isoform X2 [Hyperolius riggenbachi]